jgi:hypothetical protein
VLLFDHWLRARRPSAAIGYVLSGAFAVYLHLGAAPLVLAPLLYAVVHAALRPRAERAKEWMSLLWPALGIALAIAVFLLPAQESLLEVLRVKRDGQLPAAATWVGVLRLQLGTRQWIVTALALALIARGSALLWETQRDFLVYLATLIVAQLVGLMLLAPDRLEERAIMNRYMLVALPLLLIPLACGMTAPWRRGDEHGVVSGRAGHAQRLSALAISSVTLVALFATGPLAPGSAYWSSSFTHALTFVDFLADGNSMPKDATPSFYRSLAAPGEDATLIEYPWQNLSSHTFDAYQRTHGLNVVVSSVIDRSSETRIALRNRVEPTAERFLASRARYLVVHKNLRIEASRLVSGDIHLRYWLRARKELWDPLRRAAETMSNKLVRTWGPPSYEDVSIRVWDLDLVRRDAYKRGNGADVRRREGR